MRSSREKNTGLHKAERLFKEKKFAETIRLLEPQVFTYRENPKFYYLLGVSCLYMGDYAGANSYLKRSIQLDPDRTESLLGLAVVHLKRHEINESLRIWLEVLEEDPKNRTARAGLDVVKKYSRTEDGFETFFDSRGEASLIPSPGFYVPVKLRILILVVIASGFLAAGGIFLWNHVGQGGTPSRPEIADVRIEQSDVVIDTEFRAVYMLSEGEIRRSFEEIKQLFEKYEDNLARREINRLLLSNAGRMIKDKVGLFIPYIRTPNFADFPESFSFQEVMSSPALHEGCFVRWKGRISNIKITDKEITFDFLAGYHDQKILEGIVPARMDFAARLDPAFAYEIIARIVPKGGNALSLKIESIHELGL